MCVSIRMAYASPPAMSLIDLIAPLGFRAISLFQSLSVESFFSGYSSLRRPSPSYPRLFRLVRGCPLRSPRGLRSMPENHWGQVHDPSTNTAHAHTSHRRNVLSEQRGIMVVGPLRTKDSSFVGTGCGQCHGRHPHDANGLRGSRTYP